MIASARLSDWCEAYLTAKSLAPYTRTYFRRSCRMLAAWADTDCISSLLSESTVSQWIAELEQRFKARTVVNHRANVLTIWRFAADCGVASEPVIRRVRRPKVPPPMPRAWTLEELRRVLAAAQQETTSHRQYLPTGGGEDVRPSRRWRAVRNDDYFVALILAAHDTGLRKSDLWSLRADQIGPDGRLWIRMHKTAQPQLVSLRGRTLDAIGRLAGHPQPLLWNCVDSAYYRVWRRICRRARVPHGSTQRIRRTAATLVWLGEPDNPGRVQAFLGHQTPSMWRYYVDRSRATHAPPQPPEID